MYVMIIYNDNTSLNQSGEESKRTYLYTYETQLSYKGNKNKELYKDLMRKIQIK